jgi:NusA-like KH domain protein
MRKFDTELIQIITAFENITGTEVRDCINSNVVYFVVNTGKIALTIGKNGKNIKTAERILKKAIKVFEWNENSKEFLNNMIPKAQKIQINGDSAVVILSRENRGAVIGKGGDNINAIRKFLERNSTIKKLKVV